MGLQRLKDEASVLANESEQLRIEAEITEGEYRLHKEKRKRAWDKWAEVYGAAMGAAEKVTEIELRLGKNESGS